jgi:GxxExxY protein
MIPEQFLVKPGHQFEPLSAEVIGAALAVHKDLGPGFGESLYQNALGVALRNRKVGYETQRMVEVRFKGVAVGRYWLDMVVANQIIVELKAVKKLADIHHAQIRAYLKASGLPIGLLINFNEPVLRVRRFVNQDAACIHFVPSSFRAFVEEGNQQELASPSRF